MASVSVSNWGTQAIRGHGRGLPVEKSCVLDLNTVDTSPWGQEVGSGGSFYVPG